MTGMIPRFNETGYCGPTNGNPRGPIKPKQTPSLEAEQPLYLAQRAKPATVEVIRSAPAHPQGDPARPAGPNWERVGTTTGKSGYMAPFQGTGSPARGGEMGSSNARGEGGSWGRNGGSINGGSPNGAKPTKDNKN